MVKFWAAGFMVEVRKPEQGGKRESVRTGPPPSSSELQGEREEGTLPRTALSESTLERTTLAESRHAVAREAIAGGCSCLDTSQLGHAGVGAGRWDGESWEAGGGSAWVGFPAELCDQKNVAPGEVVEIRSEFPGPRLDPLRRVRALQLPVHSWFIVAPFLPLAPAATRTG